MSYIRRYTRDRLAANKAITKQRPTLSEIVATVQQHMSAYRPTLYMPMQAQERPRVQAALFTIEPRTEEPAELECDHVGTAREEQRPLLPCFEPGCTTNHVDTICGACGRRV